jgi:hypothetical protein
MTYAPLNVRIVDYGYHRLAGGDSDVVLRYADSGVLQLPNDANDPLPVGFQFAIESGRGTVIVEPDDGVELAGSVRKSIRRNETGVLVKENANFWLLSLGTGGGGGGATPLPPAITACFGVSAGALVAWDAPLDDGGSPITGYIVEQSLNQTDWSTVDLVDAVITNVTVNGLTPGTVYYFRVKAVNENGISDPSSPEGATPSEDYNDASGGTIATYTLDGRVYRSHTFTNGGDFVVAKAINPFDILVIGGGAGGGGGIGSGGGGAGGFYEKIGQVLDPIKYAITVGGPGASSVINGIITVPGGGAGSTRDSTHGGGNGASGGGGNSGSYGEPGGSGTPPFGNNGGGSRYSQSQVMGGGGGGAGGAGEGPNQDGFGGGNGGPGKASAIRTGVAETYCTGGNATSRDRTNGGAAKGYGGGGGAGGNAGNPGIVVVRYEIAPTPDPPTVRHSAAGEWTITNHDAAYIYTAQTTSGTATVTGNKITCSGPNSVTTLMVQIVAAGPSKSVYVERKAPTCTGRVAEEYKSGCANCGGCCPGGWNCEDYGAQGVWCKRYECAPDPVPPGYQAEFGEWFRSYYPSQADYSDGDDVSDKTVEERAVPENYLPDISEAEEIVKEAKKRVRKQRDSS